MQQSYNAPPFNPLPPVVLALTAALVVIELIFQAGARGFGGADAVGWRIAAFNDYAFIPDLFERSLATGQWAARDMVRLVSYVFVHQGFAHLAFVLVFLLAMGKYVGELFHPIAMLVIFFGSAIVGAVVYGLVLDDRMALIGGYPAVYGLIGAYSFVMWTGLGAMHQNRAKAFTLIGFLMVFQLTFGLLFGGGNYWVAELSGFGAGFLLSFLVSPGGWARVMDKLRQR
ncbi:rhomboid family intramembrane serine protease [Oceaniglobus ichthyenteri]|uniref:rhomboid family intramembrane serine protease n=1 Tax=Oceaniglobus ichthyenteri TaxID=2136177 RepID=UPI000D3C05E4|nr:rhomboid family intramembrane serine protease [Oceaniglobus ichthyenteri]